MSAGAFNFTKYETDDGSIVNIRAQPETLAAQLNGTANAAPSGSATVTGLFPLNMGGRRRKPFSARHVVLKWSGTPPTGYSATSLVRIPVLTKATYAGFGIGDSATYLGAAATIVGKSPHMGAM